MHHDFLNHSCHGPSLHRSIADLVYTSHIGTRIPQSHMKLIYNDNKGTTGSSSHEMSRSASGNKKSKNYSILSRNRSTNDMDGREKCGAGKTLASGATGPFRSNGRGEGKAHVENDPSNADETGSRTSDGSEKMIIRQTVGWDVRYDDRH